MGEVAEDYADGSCCSWCGQYFKQKDSRDIHTHEYPVLCKECYDENPKGAKKAGLQRALVDTY